MKFTRRRKIVQQINSIICRSANTTSDGRAFHADPSGCCSICREDYEATMTLQCGHILHRNCFQEMMRHSSGTPLCPTCRKRAL